jgi:quinol monooxygenase YgiN
MSILVRFAPDDGTVDQYDEVVRQMEAKGEESPDGRQLHVCFLADGKLRVSEVWDSQEQFEAHGEVLMPVIHEAGIDPGQPEVLEVHNVIVR